MRGIRVPGGSPVSHDALLFPLNVKAFGADRGSYGGLVVEDPSYSHDPKRAGLVLSGASLMGFAAI
jgi:hypothetical protein